MKRDLSSVSQEEKERVWTRVGRRIEKKENGCWIWCGAVNSTGYSHTVAFGHQWLAHRLAWFIFNGEIPKGVTVLHHCDTPLCIHPDHLFVGTDGDYHDDRMTKAGPLDSRHIEWRSVERLARVRLKYEQEDIDKILHLKKEGWTYTDLSRATGLSSVRLLKICHRNGLRKNRAWTSEKTEMALSLLADGMTYKEVSERMGENVATVYVNTRNHVGSRYRKHSPENSRTDSINDRVEYVPLSDVSGVD